MEIIGYRFIKPEFKAEASIILKSPLHNNLHHDKCIEKFCFRANTFMSDRAKRAGILDIWFEPVYDTTTAKPDKITSHDNTWYVDTNNPDNVMYHKSNGTCWGMIDKMWVNSDIWYNHFASHDWMTIGNNHVRVNDMMLRQALRLGFVEGVSILDGNNQYELEGKPSWSGTFNTVICHIKGGGRVPLQKGGTWNKIVPKIKDYTWYTHNRSTRVIFHKQDNSGYGTQGDKWDTSNNYTFDSNPDDWKETDIVEVNHILTKFAIKTQYINKGENLFWNPNHRTLNDASNNIIMDDGVWQEKLCIVNGYEATLEGRYVKFGCALLLIEWFQDTSNRGISELTLSSGIILKKQDIINIRRFINKNRPNDLSRYFKH